MRPALALALGSLLLVPQPSRADVPAPCRLAGPAGTASVVPLVLPQGAPSLALRITTPAAVTDNPTTAVGGRQSWHLATLIAVVRASDGALVASRALQSGSSGRRVDVAAAGQEVESDVVAPTAPFNHVAGTVPDHLPPGRYVLVAFGSDGSPALPNPAWSAEAELGVGFRCVVAPVPTAIVDRDQTDLRGGTQVTGYGAGAGQGGSMALPQPQRLFVGMLDAQTQLAGHATATVEGSRARRVTAVDRLVTFAGTSGRYQVQAAWQGAFPLVLLAGVGFSVR